MSQYTWNEDKKADAQRLAEAKLPDVFWKALRGIVGDGFEQKPVRVEIEGDVLTVGRSYVEVRRDGKRVASLPFFTIRLAVRIVDERDAKAIADAKQKALADKIVWDR